MNLRELLSLPGVEEECVIRSTVGFMALHGGSQDRGTDLIARQAAAAAGASFYGIVQPPDLRVHLTSRLHDPDHSEQLGRFLAHVRVAISVHGFGRDGFALWVDPERGLIIEPYGPALRGAQTGPLTGIIVGGLNARLVARAEELLTRRFPGYRAGSQRVRLGFHPDNPVNLPVAHGVQLELPPGLRGIGPFGEHPVPVELDTIDAVVAALADLARVAADC